MPCFMPFLFHTSRICSQVALIECHGTGTALGDPIEVDALRAVLGHNGEASPVLGAAKTNIGRLGTV